MISLKSVRNLMLGAALVAAPAASYAGVFISVGFAPPALPVYTQPVAPGDGYLWNPGYWGYGPGGYYWVPGVWVQPPTVGYLWTPPYWGFEGGAYGFHEGYWGPHVGFYGGVNYGFGFGGIGFTGGRWDGGHFAYNTAVSNVNVNNIHNTYNDRTTVINNTIVNNNHTSFNGGAGGIQARPTAQEQQFSHENHVAPTAAQQSHFQNAQQNRANFASANGGHPQVAAYQRPGSTQGAVPSRGASNNPALNTNRDGFGHANEVNARQGNQQSRINNGVNNGQLTPGETRNLQQRDQSINNQAAADRAANGGNLTNTQRAQINQRQNNVSNSINRDDRNANNDAAAAARRDQSQQQVQQRAQGVDQRQQPQRPAPMQQPQRQAPQPQRQAPAPQPQRQAAPAPRQEAPRQEAPRQEAPRQEGGHPRR